MEISKRYGQLKCLVSLFDLGDGEFVFSERYTQSKDGQSVYASLLLWSNTTTEITLGAPVTSGSTTVNLLGYSGGSLTWKPAGASGIIIDVTSVKLNSLASDWTWVFKLENISPVTSSRKEKILQIDDLDILY